MTTSRQPHSVSLPSMNRFWRGLMVALMGLMSCGAGCSKLPPPQPAFEDVACHSPTGHRTARRVPRWKFDELRSRILAELHRTGGAATVDLFHTVMGELSKEMVESLGQPDELLDLVLLELETRHEVTRSDASDRLPLGKKYTSRGHE